MTINSSIPVDGATNVSVDSNIDLAFTDSGCGWTLTTEVNLTITVDGGDSIPVITNGEFQAGYTGTLELGDGEFIIMINPDDNFAENALIDVDACEDHFSFTTGTGVTPDVDPAAQDCSCKLKKKYPLQRLMPNYCSADGTTTDRNRLAVVYPLLRRRNRC
jgi:hypothetical protein